MPQGVRGSRLGAKSTLPAPQGHCQCSLLACAPPSRRFCVSIEAIFRNKNRLRVSLDGVFCSRSHSESESKPFPETKNRSDWESKPFLETKNDLVSHSKASPEEKKASSGSGYRIADACKPLRHEGARFHLLATSSDRLATSWRKRRVHLDLRKGIAKQSIARLIRPLS